MEFGYEFGSPKLAIKYQEYLTFDPISSLGTIGGTLGIYIGFSCSGLFSRALELIEDKCTSKRLELPKWNQSMGKFQIHSIHFQLTACHNQNHYF